MPFSTLFIIADHSSVNSSTNKKWFEKKKISLKDVVWEISGRGNVRSGKCLSGEISSRGSVLRGSVRLGNCSFGDMSDGEVSVGEVSVGELSSGKCQSENCPVGELSAYPDFLSVFRQYKTCYGSDDCIMFHWEYAWLEFVNLLKMFLVDCVRIIICP